MSSLLEQIKEAADPKKEKRRPWNVANIRSGRRPMSVHTLMKKEKDGTLQVKIAEVAAVFAELTKQSATRSVKEWRASQAAGDAAGADQIARGSAQLGLKPRYLENISGGGMEAGVDKMMGAAGGAAPGQAPNESGLIAKKLYKPDSPLATGQDMSKMLEMKQQFTDTARGLSPEAKSMVPAMYGHQTLQAPGGQLRHVSEHEFVPGMTSMRGDVAGAKSLQDTVLTPMARKGMPAADVPRVFEGQVAGNTGNAAMTPSGPKLVDFLPQGQGAPVRVLKKGEHDLAIPATSGSGRMDTGYDKANMNQLRQDVHRPGANYQMPALKPAAPVSASAPTPAQTAGTAVASPMARKPPAPNTAVASPQAARGALAHAPTQMTPLKPVTGLAKPMATSLAKPTSLSMRSVANAGQGLARVAAPLKPGGAVANVFQKALGKIASMISGADLLKAAQFYGPTVPFTDQLDRGASPIPRSRLDKITSREQIEGQPPKREDGRDFLAFENAPGTQLNEVAATQQPQERTASVNPSILQRMIKPVGEVGTHKAELAGLGILTAPSVDTLQARMRSHLAGEGEQGTAKRQLMGEAGHALAELGGLGVLAGPSVAHLLHHTH